MKSTAELAAEQAAFWNGPGGKGWLATYDSASSVRSPISARMPWPPPTPRPGEHVIDVGCGTGGTTAELARAVGPTGHVLGVDISEPLIDAARSHRVDNATFVVGDATTYPFKAPPTISSSRASASCSSPIRSRRSGTCGARSSRTGRLVFLAWRTPQENPWGHVPLRAAAPFLPPMPRPGPEDPGQYSFGDRARVERILKEAGFATPGIEPLDRPIWLGGTAADVAETIGRFGPMARAFADAEPAAIEKARMAIAEALLPHQGPHGVTLPGACWLVRAGRG